MAVQDKILSAVPANAGSVGEAALQGKVGILAFGKPGDVTSMAFGPVVRTGVLAADTAFGAYVAGKGIVVNSNDVANMANYEDSKVARKGQTVGFLTYGTCIIPTAQKSAAAAAMNIAVLAGAPVATAKVAGTGVTDATVNADTYGAKVEYADGEKTFAYDGSAWKLDGTAATLADYGITVSGTSADGDRVAVSYVGGILDVEVTGFKS